MSQVAGGPDGQHVSRPIDNDASTGELVSRMSSDVSQLVRDELRLAQIEVTGKAKKAAVGTGLLGAAGVLALYGGGVLMATAVLALALVMDAWLAALLVAVVLLVTGGVVAWVGKKRLGEAAPPVPTRAVEGVKRDIETIRHARDSAEDDQPSAQRLQESQP